MKYRSCSIEQKIKFLDLYKEKGSIATIEKAMGLPKDICAYWLKYENKIREDYALSLVPVDLEAILEY